MFGIVEREQALAAELARLKPDVIVTAANPVLCDDLIAAGVAL